jgi:hypothetical protein
MNVILNIHDVSKLFMILSRSASLDNVFA